MVVIINQYRPILWILIIVIPDQPKPITIGYTYIGRRLHDPVFWTETEDSEILDKCLSSWNRKLCFGIKHIATKISINSTRSLYTKCIKRAPNLSPRTMLGPENKLYWRVCWALVAQLFLDVKTIFYGYILQQKITRKFVTVLKDSIRTALKITP